MVKRKSEVVPAAKPVALTLPTDTPEKNPQMMEFLRNLAKSNQIQLKVSVPKVDQDALVIKFLGQLEDEGLHAYLNPQEDLRVRLPDDGLFLDYPIKSERTSIWFWARYLAIYNRPPTEAIIRAAVRWLQNKAYKNGIFDPTRTSKAAAADLADSDPIFVAVAAYTADLKEVGKSKSIRATDGHNELTYQAEQHHHNLKDWPKDPAVLSRRLGCIAPLLHDQQGIDFKSEHQKIGSLWTFTRVTLPSEGDTPQTVASHPKPNKGQKLELSDAGDDIFVQMEEARRERVEAERNLASEPEEPSAEEDSK